MVLSLTLNYESSGKNCIHLLRGGLLFTASARPCVESAAFYFLCDRGAGCKYYDGWLSDCAMGVLAQHGVSYAGSVWWGQPDDRGFTFQLSLLHLSPCVNVLGVQDLGSVSERRLSENSEYVNPEMKETVFSVSKWEVCQTWESRVSQVRFWKRGNLYSESVTMVTYSVNLTWLGAGFFW